MNYPLSIIHCSFMRSLTISLIQSDLHWEDPPANRKMFQSLLYDLSGNTDLVILPEMFSTGFTMNAAALAESMEGPTVGWMRDAAQRHSVDIAGSLIIKEKGKNYNRLVWVKPGGSVFAYDKRHLFAFAEEHRTYSAGDRRVTVPLKGWRIRPFICYDLRFPVWTRNSEAKYDLALFVANWPSVRSAHWHALLSARAIENQCYVVGVNRVGEDGNGLAYSGGSSVIDPAGQIRFKQEDTACVHTETLSMKRLADVRTRFPFLQDADVGMIRWHI